MANRRNLLMVLLLMLLAACTPAPSPNMAPFILVTLDPNSTATATPFQPGPDSSTSAPTSTATGSASVVLTDTPVPTLEPSSTPAPPTEAPTLPPATADSGGSPTSPPARSSRTHYTFYVTLDYAGKNVAVNEIIYYVNNTPDALSNVVLAVNSNLWANCFSLTTLSQDGADLSNSYDLTGRRLTLSLAQPLASGAGTSFSIGYSLSLPMKASDSTFGYVTKQLNLTDWYPFIVPYSGGWVLHDPSSFGEDLVYDAADFDVNIKVDDPGVMLAGPAPAEVNGDTTHYHLEAARAFALSASDSFKMDESAVGSIKIRSYYFPGDENASNAVVWMATQSLALYQAKFAPYPYPSLSLVETDLPDGQEYDGLVFLGSTMYSGYNGTARSNLVTIGTHEIAHQWWFGLVGSDQAMEPWLDEAMSVYSERIFYEYNYPKFGDWWWNFRVNYFGPEGYVDSNVYAFATFRSYVDAVYLNGANFLDDLRTRVGDEAFFAFLKDYAARFSHGHATGADFFAVVRAHTTRDFSDLLQTYFQRQY